MIAMRPTDDRPGGAAFPDDFPQRLERLRAASDLTWRALARELSVSVRSVYRWRTGTRPDAAHMLAIVAFATDRDLLDSLLSQRDDGAGDERQALLFAEDVWARLCGERVECACGHGETRRAA